MTTSTNQPAQLPNSAIPVPAPTGSGAVDAAVALWRALAVLGVRDVVVAPGSRSAPLVYALEDPAVAEWITAHVRIDERAAAFTALGMSKADPAHPAAVVTTSGTATAHLLAAVMEAHHSRVPVLVITADRPAELRGTGANQATIQTGLYERFTRFDADVPAPCPERATAAELRTTVNVAARAFAAAVGEHPGPVHVNLGFRDPLVPAAGSVAGSSVAVDLEGEPDAVIPVTRRIPRSEPDPVPVPVTARTVVVAGDGAGRAAVDFAQTTGLPLFAEPSSGARGSDCFVPGYVQALSTVMAGEQSELRPDRAVVFGRPTLTRAVQMLLGDPGVHVVVVDPVADWADAPRRARLIVPAAVPELPAELSSSPKGAYRQHWRDYAAEITKRSELTWQARAALSVWEACGDEDVLVLGSSSLVRDLDLHAGETSVRVVANRGLAGIDGIHSTAIGFALASQTKHPQSGKHFPRVRALLGDLTALHDLTGLLIGPGNAVPQLDVVVVDDNGGRIFSGLEHSRAPQETLRQFFTTPHGADIVAAAQAIGVFAQRVDVDALGDALSQSVPGVRVLVVQQPSLEDAATN